MREGKGMYGLVWFWREERLSVRLCMGLCMYVCLCKGLGGK